MIVRAYGRSACWAGCRYILSLIFPQPLAAGFDVPDESFAEEACGRDEPEPEAEGTLSSSAAGIFQFITGAFSRCFFS